MHEPERPVSLSAATRPADVDAVVVGAGFAGLYALHRLRAMGMSVHVLEAGHGVGGTWYWNRYPGARCDVESLDYSYGFSEELQQEWTWTERYAAQPEILRYAEYAAARLDLLRHVEFGVRVAAARFDEQDESWTVVPETGHPLRARWCVMATGCLSTTRVPEIPGFERYAGESYHPGAWPQGDAAPVLRGKRVGVIGTGSTGIQIIPAIAPEVAGLTVFQRTANYSMPAHNHPLDAEMVREVKASYAERRRIARATRRGFPLPAGVSMQPAFSYSAEERRARLERMWAHGGAIFTATFADVTIDHAANAVAADFVREQIRGIVRDPATAERLCPTDHPLGGKRPCVDTDYYETFNQEHVSLVDLHQTPIVEFTTGGLRTTEREIALDVVIFATGYDAITGTLNAMDIRGRGGHTLKGKWADGATAYLGLCCADFPNLFVITGPGSPSVLCNMMISIEQHVELMCALLEHAAAEGSATVEADPAAELQWAQHVADLADGTLLVEANSWYMGANIPGKPRMFMPYAAGMALFDEECHGILDRDYEGFAFGTPVARAAPQPG